MAEFKTGKTRAVSMVNHPPYYQSASGLEVIEVIEAFDLGHCLGNAVKYTLRHGKKGARRTFDREVEDIGKAIWYLNRHLQQLQKEQPTGEVQLDVNVRRNNLAKAAADSKFKTDQVIEDSKPEEPTHSPAKDIADWEDSQGLPRSQQQTVR